MRLGLYALKRKPWVCTPQGQYVTSYTTAQFTGIPPAGIHLGEKLLRNNFYENHLYDDLLYNYLLSGSILNSALLWVASLEPYFTGQPPTG